VVSEHEKSQKSFKKALKKEGLLGGNAVSKAKV